MKKIFSKSYKTSFAGIAMAVLTYLLAAEKIDVNIYAMASGILASLGFVAAKDGDKSGTNR